MKPARTLLVFSLLAATALAAYAAAPLPSAFSAPTSEQLGLSGAYAAQWNDLRGQTLAQRDAARNTAQQEIAKLQALLQTSAPDLDAFSNEVEQQVDAYLAQARVLNSKKLAFYDSLPAPQQAQVRAVMSERIERLQHLRAALGELAAATP